MSNEEVEASPKRSSGLFAGLAVSEDQATPRSNENLEKTPDDLDTVGIIKEVKLGHGESPKADASTNRSATETQVEDKMLGEAIREDAQELQDTKASPSTIEHLDPAGSKEGGVLEEHADEDTRMINDATRPVEIENKEASKTDVIDQAKKSGGLLSGWFSFKKDEETSEQLHETAVEVNKISSKEAVATETNEMSLETEHPKSAGAGNLDDAADDSAPPDAEKKMLSQQESNALNEAFSQPEMADAAPTEEANKDSIEATGSEVYEATPIPNGSVALTILRKFALKTRSRVSVSYGGVKGRPLLSYLFGTKEDKTFIPYRDFMNSTYEDGEDRDAEDESGDGVDTESLDSADRSARARNAVASFIALFSVWGHASSRLLERKDRKMQVEFSSLLSSCFDTASELVAHGCLDGVDVCVGQHQEEKQSAIHLLAQSVFNSDLSIESIELAAMKLLLITGCRVDSRNDALLHGSHLLQSIRVLYHVYLTTDSVPNKTTARAALQQLTSSIFARVVRQHVSDENRTHDHFPSNNHRDAFLVLRSVCKLSMRNLPDMEDCHVGLQSSGSNEFWDEENNDSTTDVPHRLLEKSSHGRAHESVQLLFTSAVHPALESKLLALELILYVLQNTAFTKSFVQSSGAQFHAAVRNYLCVSVLKNCTSEYTRVVNLSLRIFVPLVRSFRTLLKNEIEAFVTNVFFVILDSQNSPVEHKSIVVKTFDEICSDPATLAEIFLNYDCDLSAVDLFHRIVNTLSTVSRTEMNEKHSTSIFMGGQNANRLEKSRNENRDLRLGAMKALRQILASLHASIVKPMSSSTFPSLSSQQDLSDETEKTRGNFESGGQNLVDMYGSKKKRRAEEAEAILKFNRKPSAGITFAVERGHIEDSNPLAVARYLLKNKDSFDKTQIGEYLGREMEYQGGFAGRVLHEYVGLLDFTGLLFDDAIRFFLSGFRLPGEAQKIDRIMEKFAERFTIQNPNVFPTADVAFILAFSIIMLNTDLHNPAIKEERRMTKEGFVRNNRGICDGKDLPEELLTSIFDRIQSNSISLKEDDDARQRASENGDKLLGTNTSSVLSPASFFTSHYDEVDRARESNFQKERDHILRTTESLLKRQRSESGTAKVASRLRFASRHSRHSQKFVLAQDSGLRDEYVAPMFDVTWGPALAAFSTAIESANGTVGKHLSVVSDDEMERSIENAAETIEVCLTGFRFAIGTAGLCSNDVARDSYMLALARFSQLGTGVLLEPRHLRCIQTLLSLAREDGELLGNSWEHIFRSLSEINRFHQLFHLMARNDRVAAAAADRRRRQLEARGARIRDKKRRQIAAEDSESVSEHTTDESFVSDDNSLAESDLFDDGEYLFEDEMDAKSIDEANARAVYDAVSESMIEAIYERSSSLSALSISKFVMQLSAVSESEIMVGYSADEAATTLNDLTKVAYRGQHKLITQSKASGPGTTQFHHSQPNIYNLQKLVEVTHYNMDSRPRLIFQELWSIVAGHLTQVALHPNPAIAMYAVDSFRQLCTKFLEKDELEVFEFQKKFLKPLSVVMLTSHQENTKELLLDCIARLIRLYGGGNPNASERKGGLKSGWVPILGVLGAGGLSSSLTICRLSFEMLTEAIHDSTEQSQHPSSSHETGVVHEYFVETIDALFAFVRGPHVLYSEKALEEVMNLVQFLHQNATKLHVSKRRALGNASHTGNDCLELWWPILLGLSHTVGDYRQALRERSVEALRDTIKAYFVPTGNALQLDGAGGEQPIQTLQLIFRGILAPILENAETEIQCGVPIPLPDDFDLFLVPKRTTTDPEDAEENQTWLQTTFDMFIELCVSICLESMRTLQTQALVDEVLAILNNCINSDCGALAVSGLRRLEQFVSSDLDATYHGEELWATVCHMVRKCLSVYSLPSPTAGESAMMDQDEALPEKRLVGLNSVWLIGMLLSNSSFGIGIRWHLFLMAGLSRGIMDWERAAALVDQPETVLAASNQIPTYTEISVYARKLMNSCLLHLASRKEVAQADADPRNSRDAAGQKLITDEIQRLLSRYIDIERIASDYKHVRRDEILLIKFTELVNEVLCGLQNMGAEHLSSMQWLNPTLLQSCIQCKNEDIRFSVKKLVQQTTPGAVTPYPVPDLLKSTDKEETKLETTGKRTANNDSCLAEDIAKVADVQDESPIDAQRDGPTKESNRSSTGEGSDGGTAPSRRLA